MGTNKTSRDKIIKVTKLEIVQKIEFLIVEDTGRFGILTSIISRQIVKRLKILNMPAA